MVWLAISCSLPQIVLRAIRLVLILRTNDAIHPSMPSPCLLVAEASVWATSPLAVTVKHIFCDFLFFSQLCCPLRFQNSPQTHLWKHFVLRGNFSSFSAPSAGQVSIPSLFLCFFVFYILSHLLLKIMGSLSGCLVSSARIQKLFCGSCSTFKWSFYKFVGEKVVSLSYFSAILGPAPFLILLIWVFCLLSSVWLMVCQFCLFFQRTNF